jgi:hypothetical protein
MGCIHRKYNNITMKLTSLRFMGIMIYNARQLLDL